MGTRLKLAAGFLGASHAGISYEPDARGVIDVESPEAVQIFTNAPFNFSPATPDDEGDEPESFDSMTKVELVQWLVDRGVEVPAGKIRKPILLEMVEEYQQKKAAAPSDDDGEDEESEGDGEE